MPRHGSGAGKGRGQEAIQEVLAAPPEEFTALRNRRAKELASAGDPEAAAAVKALRKPTKALWAVNRLAREAGAGVQQLVDATAQLRRAQGRAAAGAGAEELRAAAARQREIIRELRARAADLLGRSKSSGEAQLDRVEATLLGAASGAGEQVDALRRGSLTSELPAPGFDALLGFPLPRRPKAGRKPKPEPKSEAEPEPEHSLELRRAAESAEREASAAAEEARRARREVAESERRLAEARAALQAASADLRERRKVAAENAARARKLAQAAERARSRARR